MRRTYYTLLATAILTAPLPVAAQVTIDPNALNALGPALLPAPPPATPAALHRSHHWRPHHLASAAHRPSHPAATAVAAAETPAANGQALEHPKNLGASFTSLPPLPSLAPPLPPPPPVLPSVTAKAKPVAKPTAIAQATPPAPQSAPTHPSPNPAPQPAAKTAASAPPAAAIPPQLALPGAAPPPATLPAASPPPARLAETTPGPAAAAGPTPASPAPTAAKPSANTLPAGADLLTLPFFVQESELPPAETAMLRDFAQRYGPNAQYIIRAYASQPAGDDDPSTPRRIALARAESVAAALLDSGALQGKLRLLALGNAGGSPANRVEVIAMPPASGHTAPSSSP